MTFLQLINSIRVNTVKLQWKNKRKSYFRVLLAIVKCLYCKSYGIHWNFAFRLTCVERPNLKWPRLWSQVGWAAFSCQLSSCSEFKKCGGDCVWQETGGRDRNKHEVIRKAWNYLLIIRYSLHHWKNESEIIKTYLSRRTSRF